ncbi:MAG: hypothetical protein E7434_05940 [Ruminococcaceae bacterium]|nr:hypothetical protein [Oscillospiraceae bacterium]
MFFFKKKKRVSVAPKTDRFESAFKERLGRSPIDYIAEKIASGSDAHSTRYLFDIVSAEIASKSLCVCPGFDYYYSQILDKKAEEETKCGKPVPKVTKGFAASQLIGKERFLKQNYLQINALSQNHEFMQFIGELRSQLSGQELYNTRAANRKIADYFYVNKANDRFPEVKTIVDAVLCYGKQASAHISIYYAMFLCE